MSDSLWPHGLYSPWNSPGQNTKVGSLSLLQRIFTIQGSNPGLLHCRQILCHLSHQASPREYWSGLPCPSPGDLPDPGIKPRSPALQSDSLPSEPQGKPKNTGVGSLSFLQWIFPIQELNQGLLLCRRVLYQPTKLSGKPIDLM